jgi:hypothetical protein
MNVGTRLGSDACEASHPAAGVEHTLAAQLFEAPAGFLNERVARARRPVCGVELRLREAVPLESERSRIELAWDEAGDTVDDQISVPAGAAPGLLPLVLDSDRSALNTAQAGLGQLLRRIAH